MPNKVLPSPHRRTTIGGFVLVGGASSRMGQDKSQMVIGGKKFFERPVTALREISGGNISLVGGQGDQVSAGLRAVSKFLPDLRISGNNMLRAPIFGVYTALANSKTDWIAILACDLPFVTAELMIKLTGFRHDKFDAVVPMQPDARPQPLCSLYRRARCLPAVEECLTTGELKLQQFLSRISTRYVEFAEIAELDGSTNFFLNVNTPENYETALKMAGLLGRGGEGF